MKMVGSNITIFYYAENYAGGSLSSWLGEGQGPGEVAVHDHSLSGVFIVWLSLLI